jgi:hypothetical protein
LARQRRNDQCILREQRRLSDAGRRQAAAAEILQEVLLPRHLAGGEQFLEGVAGVEVTAGGRLPPVVYIGLAVYLLIGLLIVADSLRRVWRWRRAPRQIPFVNAQFTIWAALLVAGVVLGLFVSWAHGLLAILVAQVLPRGRKRAKATQGN